MIAFNNQRKEKEKEKVINNLKIQNQKVWSMKYNSILFIFCRGMHQLKVEF